MNLYSINSTDKFIFLHLLAFNPCTGPIFKLKDICCSTDKLSLTAINRNNIHLQAETIKYIKCHCTVTT